MEEASGGDAPASSFDVNAARRAMRAEHAWSRSGGEGEHGDLASKDEDTDEDMRGVVRMPQQRQHSYFILIRPPKGGLKGGYSALQKLAARLSSRFNKRDDVILRATQSEPYLVENGKLGQHYLVLMARTAASTSESIAERIMSWPEVIGIHRKHSIEALLFGAFADIYDTTNNSCILVPPRGSRQKVKLGHGEPKPAISLDALQHMCTTLGLELEQGQVRSSVELHADAQDRTISWNSVALHVTRCLRPHYKTVGAALEVLEEACDKQAGWRLGTISISLLHTALRKLRKKLGLSPEEVDALAKRARKYSDGAQYVDYKAFLLHICSAVAATPAPTPSDLTQRQKAARLLEGSRSRDVARLIATDWKLLDPAERAKFETRAKNDYLRYTQEKQAKIQELRHNPLAVAHAAAGKPRKMSRVLLEILRRGAKREPQEVAEPAEALQRWGMQTLVCPPRSAFSYFASGALQKLLSDDLFTDLYRVKRPGSKEVLLSFSGFCQWFQALPLPVKAQLFSIPHQCLVAKCPIAFRELHERRRARAEQRKRQVCASAEREEQAREVDRIRSILRQCPGLQVLFETYALVIPESVLSVDHTNVTKGNVFKSFASVFTKSELLSMANVMRLAQDFHIIPVLLNRQGVANVFKACKVVSRNVVTNDEVSGLTLEGFVRFIEGVAAASTLPVLEKRMLKEQGRSLSLLDKFHYLTGDRVLAATDIRALDVKLRKMNARVYEYVCEHVASLADFIEKKHELIKERQQEREVKAVTQRKYAEMMRRWTRLARLMSLGFLEPQSLCMTALRQVFLGYAGGGAGGGSFGRVSSTGAETDRVKKTRINLVRLKEFLVHLKVVPDSDVAAAGTQVLEKPMLTSTELANLYIVYLEEASTLSLSIPTKNIQAKVKKEDPPTLSGSKNKKETPSARTPGSAKQHENGLSFPEFVDLLHSSAFFLYSNHDIFEAAYPNMEEKVDALYKRLLLFDHAALRATLIHYKVIAAKSSWPDSYSYAPPEHARDFWRDDFGVCELGADVVQRAAQIEVAKDVLPFLGGMSAELQQASTVSRTKRKGQNRNLTAALRGNIKAHQVGSKKFVSGTGGFSRTASSESNASVGAGGLLGQRRTSLSFGQRRNSLMNFQGFGRTASTGSQGSNKTIFSRVSTPDLEEFVQWFDTADFHYRPADADDCVWWAQEAAYAGGGRTPCSDVDSLPSLSPLKAEAAHAAAASSAPLSAPASGHGPAEDYVPATYRSPVEGSYSLAPRSGADALMTYSSGTNSPSVIPKKVHIETETGAFAKLDVALKKEREEKRLQRHRLILGLEVDEDAAGKAESREQAAATQAIADAQQVRHELAGKESVLLLRSQHMHRNYSTGHEVAPHLVAQHLRSEEEHFLRWVAGKKLQGLSEGEGGVKEGKVGGEEEQVVEKGGGEKVEVAVAGAAAVVLEALRKEEERLRERRKEIDTSVQGLRYMPNTASIKLLDSEKIPLSIRGPTGKWWERSDRSFTENNLRNNLVLQVLQVSGGDKGHSQRHTPVVETSPELDRLERKRHMQVVGCAQRRGESWCAKAGDKTLRVPGSKIKKQERFSGAPALDAMKMDLGDEIRSQDGWLWVVRSCGGKKQWVRTGFESNIKSQRL